MWWIESGVLVCSIGSCCNLPWMASRAGSAGTDVNRAFTLYEGKHSS